MSLHKSWARCAAREPWEPELCSQADSTAQRVLAMYGVQDGIVLVAGDGCESAKGAEEDIWVTSGRRWMGGVLFL